jgi:hypothetical protein
MYMLRGILSSLVIVAFCATPLFAEEYISPQISPQLERDFAGEWNPLLMGINPSGLSEREMPGLCYRILGDWIRASGYVNLGEFLGRLPGIRMEQQLGAAGTSEDYSGLKPLIMTDGIPIETPNGKLLDVNLIPLENVDYVEVYPGPLAGIYGDFSTVINIVTLHRRNEQPKAYLMIADGSFDLERYKFAYSQSIPHYDFTLSGDRQLYTGQSDHIVEYSGGNLTLTSALYGKGFYSLAGFSWSGSSQLSGEIIPTKVNSGLSRVWIAPQLKYGDWNFGGAYAFHRQKDDAGTAQSHFFRLGAQYKPPSNWGWYNSLEGESSGKGTWKGEAVSSLGFPIFSVFNALSALRVKADADKNYTIAPVVGVTFVPSESTNLFADFQPSFNHSPENGNSKSYAFLGGGKLYFLNRGRISASAFYDKTGNDMRRGMLLDLQFRLPDNFTLQNSTSLYNRITNHQPKLQIVTQFAYNPSFNRGNFSLYAGVEHSYYSSGIAFSPLRFKNSVGKDQGFHLWDLRFSVRVLSVEVFLLVENLLNSKVKSQYGVVPGYPRLYRVGFSWYFRN